jgi:hypothetical protein
LPSRGEEKKREGQVGEPAPGWAEEGGGSDVRTEWGPVGSGAPLAEAGGGRAPWSEQGRKWGAKSGPGATVPAAVRILSKIKFQTDSNHIQILSNFDSSKKDPPELEKFEIKYVCEGFKERNNFLHRNVFRFETYFKLKLI